MAIYGSILLAIAGRILAEIYLVWFRGCFIRNCASRLDRAMGVLDGKGDSSGEVRAIKICQMFEHLVF